MANHVNDCSQDVSLEILDGKRTPHRPRSICEDSLLRCVLSCRRFGDSLTRKPSNETLLSVAFVSFISFVAVQFSVAYVAKSEAMMGDSAAMLVDALTYGFNLVAERKKNEVDEPADEHNPDFPGLEVTDKNTSDAPRDEGLQSARTKEEKEYEKRRHLLKLELVPPLMSVSILIVVISFVLKEAIHVLILDASRKESDQSIPNLTLMMTFSILNLLLDVVNMTCFARAKHLMGYATNEKSRRKSVKYDKIDVNNSKSNEDTNELVEDDDDNDEKKNSTEGGDTITEDSCEVFDETHEGGIRDDELSVESHSDEEDERVNLNMCSAYTHVFADTLRSTAVIIASVIAGIGYTTPEEADATAAVIVSVIIFASLVPLFRGLFCTWSELRQVDAEMKALKKRNPQHGVIELV